MDQACVAQHPNSSMNTGGEEYSVPNGIRIGAQHDGTERDSVKQATSRTRDDASERSGTAQSQGVPEPGAALDPIDAALTEALKGASAAGQWQVVSQLAAELEARRVAKQAPEVVSLAAARAKRDGGKP